MAISIPMVPYASNKGIREKKNCECNRIAPDCNQRWTSGGGGEGGSVVGRLMSPNRVAGSGSCTKAAV